MERCTRIIRPINILVILLIGSKAVLVADLLRIDFARVLTRKINSFKISFGRNFRFTLFYQEETDPPFISTDNSLPKFVIKPLFSLKLSSILQIFAITSESNINSVNYFSNSSKRARFMKSFARISNIFSSNRKPIPIPMNNLLPCISFQLELKTNQDNRIRMLVDTEMP